MNPLKALCLITVFLATSLILGCNSESPSNSDDTTEPPESSGAYVYPDSASYVSGPNVELAWHAHPEYHDDLYNYLIFCTVNEEHSDPIVAHDTTHQLVDLAVDDSVSWLVLAQSNSGDQDWGPRWHFFVTDLAPDPPVYISPDSGAYVAGTEVEITWHTVPGWSAQDVDYLLLLGRNEGGWQWDAGDDTTYLFTSLEHNDSITWQVLVAHDGGPSVPGPEWYFIVDDSEPMPTSPSPSNGDYPVSVATDLSWAYTGATGSVTHCDVYLGNNPDPQLVGDDQSGTIYDPPSNLDYTTIYYWKIVAFTSPTDSAVGPVWSFTTESVLTTDPYVRFEFTSDHFDSFYSWDEIKFWFDESYAPDGPVNALYADSVTVNGNPAMENTYTGVYSYWEESSLPWLDNGASYDFVVHGNAHVPDLTLETTFLECSPLITYPTTADTMHSTGFTATWNGVCDGNIQLKFIIAGNDTIDPGIDVPNTGSYEFSEGILDSLEGYTGVITLAIIFEDSYNIMKPGYSGASEVYMRSTHTVTTIID